MITKVFETLDTNLYTTWHSEDGGIVSLVVPDVGEIKMSIAKAEDIGESLLRNVEYGRNAGNILNLEH